jgi:putative transcriptional regulator
LGRRTRCRDQAAVKNRLRELRAIRGWTQVDLADRLDVSRQTIYAIETGRYDPSLSLVFKIAALFGERIESLFFPADDDSATSIPTNPTERNRNVPIQNSDRA